MRHTIDHLLIGDRLTRLMAEHGLCAADVARMLDGGKNSWSSASVRKWMVDESQPSATTLVGLADILGCSLDYLMTGKEYRPKRTLDSTMVSVEDVLEAIRDYAHYPDAQLHAGDLMTHLEHALKGR